MNIRESDLPGIGRKFEIEVRGGDKLVIIVHDDGRRELYHFYHDDPDESISMITLNDEDARSVAAIIGGLAYKPKDLDTKDVILDNLVVEWYKIEASSKCIGKTIGELEVRQKTGATIIAAIGRDHQKCINPQANYVLVAETTIVIVGERKHIKSLKEYLFGGNI